MDKILNDLNPDQKKAVTFDEQRPLLVLAGAGSGKTRVLTHRAAWLLANKKEDLEGLLLLTFTNKAAGEMKRRLQKILSQNSKFKIKNSNLFTGTFHSFGAYILRREANRVGISRNFVIFDQKDQLSLARNLIKKMNLPKKKYRPKTVISVINSAKNDLIDYQAFLESAGDEWQENIGLVYQNYQKKIRKANGLDFGDLLYLTVELFKENKTVLKKYQQIYNHILIDEYQDTNKSQYAITRLLAGGHQHLTVVGDASQAIYSWRGADYRNLSSLKKDFSNVEIINLERNYRSTETILEAANKVISENKLHPVLKLYTEKNTGKKITVYQAKDDFRESEYISNKIEEQITNGVDPTQIAVLYRTNAQSRALEEAFIRRGLPYILFGGTKFYERAEIKDVLALIRVWYNRNDSVSWERIEKNMGVRRMRRVKNFLQKKQTRKTKTAELLNEILSASGYLEKYDQENKEDYRRLENIKELSSVAHQFPDVDRFLESVALVQQEYFVQEKKKAGKKDQAIRLMTLHSSKGLEFEVVFIAGMEEGLLPHSRSMQNLEELEEERRLCYVGMTRAKKQLYLTYAVKRLYFGKTNYNSPSRFLENIPSHLKVEILSEKTIDDWDWDDDDWLEEW
jgi:DNA helicase II / ATP-dependent DNA helicase PcrA